MNLRVSVLLLGAAFVWTPVAAGAQQPAAPSADAQVAISEAKYQNSLLLDRVLVCVMQVGRDNQEATRLTAELTAVKAELDKLKKAEAAKPAPDTPATEPPK